MRKYSIIVEEDGTELRNIPIEANERIVVDGEWYVLSIGGNVSHRPYRKKEWLNTYYHDKELTLQQIGDMCGVSPMTINQWLVKHGIESRPRGRRSE